MLKKLTVTNFRGFAELELELQSVNVLLGPNSSGKSSVLHAIRIAAAAMSLSLNASGLSDQPIEIRDGMIWFCRKLPVRDPSLLMPVSDARELFTNRDPYRPITVRLEYEPDDSVQRATVYFSYGFAEGLTLSVGIESPPGLEILGVARRGKHSVVSPAQHKMLRALLPTAVFVPQFNSITALESFQTGASIHRMLQNGEQSRLVRNLVARLTGPELDMLNRFLGQSLDASLVDRTVVQEIEDNEYLQVRFRDTNGALELSSAGSGLVGLVGLYASIERYRSTRENRGPVTLLVDEPDAHLHPKLQGEIGFSLANMATEFGAQLLIATHSVEMINRLAQRPGSRLLSIDRVASRAIALTSQDELLRELGAFCDLSPFAAINFLSSRKILFHEGPSDALILRRCAETLYRHDGQRLQRFGEWTLLSLNGVSNAGGVDLWTRLLSPDLFAGLAVGPLVQILRVRDRDMSLQPGWRQHAATGRVRMDDLVWPRHSIESLFLEPACLAEWIIASDPVASGMRSDPLRPRLQGFIDQALTQADGEIALQRAAEDGLRQVYLRTGKPGLAEATKQARDDADKNPAVWQPGRDRASFVLSHVRKTLKAENEPRVDQRILGSVKQLVERADVHKIDLNAGIPADVRALLERMTAPA